VNVHWLGGFVQMPWKPGLLVQTLPKLAGAGALQTLVPGFEAGAD